MTSVSRLAPRQPREPTQRGARPWVPRWPRMAPLMAGPAFVLMAVVVLGAVMLFDVTAAYMSAFVSGLNKGYAEGVAAGHRDTCSDLVTQARYALDAEQQMVTSGAHSPAEGSVVSADSHAALRFTCNPSASPTPNPYDPGAVSPPLPLRSPTLPVAPPRKPVRRI